MIGLGSDKNWIEAENWIKIIRLLLDFLKSNPTALVQFHCRRCSRTSSHLNKAEKENDIRIYCPYYYADGDKRHDVMEVIVQLFE